MFFFFFNPAALGQKPEWARFADALHFARTQHPNMTIGTLSTLIEVVRHTSPEGMPPRLSDLADALDIPYPTLMRQTDLLSKGVGRAEGLDLIEKHAAPDNRRERTVAFTPQGLAFLGELENLLTAPGQTAIEPAQEH